MAKERRTREVLEKKIWERFAGAALGGIWGLFLLVLILMGLLIAGNLQDTIKKFNNQRAGLKKQVGTSSEKIKPTTQREIPAAGSFSVIKKHIEDSPFGYIARKLNPLDAEVMNRFKDLMIIIGDPVLFAKFRSHKSIIRVTGHPKFLKVAEDTNIKFLLKNKQYFKLLDHPKIASLVNDKEIFRELKKIDFKKVFVQVLKE